MGRLLTGKRKLLSSDFVAVETHLGCTLMGKIPQINTERVNLAAVTVTSLFVKEAEISDIWRVDLTGVDAAGPLFLRGNQKAWVLLFTCAVYGAVHLELISSLSHEAFLMGFRRFVARRGRCSTIYGDNGTNFVDADICSMVQIGIKLLNMVLSTHSIGYLTLPPETAWWGRW
ncbi:hypothetical protein AVEN_133321-1 [Araneus ventricosus]|uniref:Integrase catalytic domain-containing protein n=1 Tax=Araneus ventricosus TaxID=182803 RepID=A0A4Y2DN20_ARAVE|nr:hypothetical protein AVEN_133321-1 [Araneus ventricosus]